MFGCFEVLICSVGGTGNFFETNDVRIEAVTREVKNVENAKYNTRQGSVRTFYWN